MKTNVKKDSKLLGIGILGCGLISQAAHLPGAAKAHNIRLRAVCDASDELREKMTAIYSPEKSYSSYEDMLADPEV